MNKQGFVRFTLITLAVLVAAMSMPAKAEQGNVERDSDTLMPIVTCMAKGHLQLAKTSRLPAHILFRQVMTADGNRKVSTLDGYKLLLETAPNITFVDLKVEQSDAKLFLEDRAAIMAQMEKIDASKSAQTKPMSIRKQHDIEVIALNQPSLNVTGPLSVYTFLSEAKSVIATAYVMNQPIEQRAFKTMSEYEVLRDLFVEDLVACLKADQAISNQASE